MHHGTFHDSPVFVVGLPRSGTSLMQAMLDGHPDIVALVGETKPFEYMPTISFEKIVTRMGVQHIYSGDDALPGVTRSDVKARVARELDGVDDLKGVLRTVVNTTRAYLPSSGDGNPETAGQPVCWLEKTPTNYFYIPTIERMYARRAKYIWMLRDPRDTFLSQTRLRVHGTKDRFVRNALFYYVLLEQQKSALGPRARVVVYEDLVTRTDEVMSDVLKFLGLADHRNAHFPTRLGRVPNDIVDGSRVFLRNTITASSIGKWREGLDEETRTYIEAWLVSEMRRYGYLSRMPRALMPLLTDMVYRSLGWQARRFLRSLPEVDPAEFAANIRPQ